MDYIISIIPQMLMGTVDTLRLFFITIVLAIPLGILLAFCRVRHTCMCCGARL